MIPCDQELKKERRQKLEEVVRLVKSDQITGYAEKIDFDPVMGKNNEVEKWVPLNYIVSFIFKDAATGKDVKVSIDTQIEGKKS